MNVPMLVRSAAVTAVLGLLAACGDAPTAADTSREGLRPPFDAAAASSGANLSLSGDVQTSITVDPTRTQFYQIGDHWVYIPAGAMCRLDSSYGVSEWDKDCVSHTAAVTIPVTVGVRNDRPLVEFGVDLRFKPTNDPHKAAYLYLHDPAVEQDKLKKYAVLWRGADGVWVDEAATDKTLRVFRVEGKWFGRRVKHFSGYNVSLGINEQLDPTLEIAF